MSTTRLYRYSFFAISERRRTYLRKIGIRSIVYRPLSSVITPVVVPPKNTDIKESGASVIESVTTPVMVVVCAPTLEVRQKKESKIKKIVVYLLMYQQISFRQQR